MTIKIVLLPYSAIYIIICHVLCSNDTSLFKWLNLKEKYSIKRVVFVFV